jgi:hypothetical protein
MPTVCCKVGSVDRAALGIGEEIKVRPNTFEPLCNPIAQASIPKGDPPGHSGHPDAGHRRSTVGGGASRCRRGATISRALG